MAGLLLTLVWAGAGAAAEPPRTSAPGMLRIGTYFVESAVQYLAKGAEGRFRSRSHGGNRARLALRPVFVNTHWETILKEMQEGRYDCIVGGITITPERERLLAWSVCYQTTTLSLVVNAPGRPRSTAWRT